MTRNAHATIKLYEGFKWNMYTLCILCY